MTPAISGRKRKARSPRAGNPIVIPAGSDEPEEKREPRAAFQTRISSFPVVLPDVILVNASPTPSSGHSPPIRGFNAPAAFDAVLFRGMQGALIVAFGF